MRFPRLHFLAATVCSAGLLPAAVSDARIEALFRPPLGEWMALAPDGQRLAYTASSDGKLSIVILNLDQPGKRRRIPVEPVRSAGTGSEATESPRLRFLRWATSARLVYAPVERVVPLPPITDPTGSSIPNPDGPTIISPILVLDASGQERGTLVDANQFQETPATARRSLADILRTNRELAVTRNQSVHWRMPHLDILGFLPRDRHQLVIGTRGAYSMPLVYTVDLRTGEVRDYGDDWPIPPDEPVVFDWFRHQAVGERLATPRPATRWRDTDLGRIQRELENKFPHRIVEILDWSDNHSRLLFRVTGGTDPGRIFVYQRPEDLALEVFPCAPWLNTAQLHPTRWFEFAAPDGGPISGYLTRPAKSPAPAPPLVIVFSPSRPGTALPAFDAESQVLADLGFLVVRLNHRDFPAHEPRPAGENRVVAAVAAVIGWLERRSGAGSFDRSRVGVLGHEHGGHLARRALELRPDLLRCAFAFDLPTRPATPPPATATSLLGAGADRERNGPDPAPEIPATTPPVGAWQEDATAGGRPWATLALGAGTARLGTEARAQMYRRLANFFHQHLATTEGRREATRENP